MLLAVVEYLRSPAIRNIRLQVDGSNTPAVWLYASVGLEKADELHWFERGVP